MRGLILSLSFLVAVIAALIIGLFGQIPAVMMISMFCAGPIAFMTLGFQLARFSAGKRFVIEDRERDRGGQRSIRPAAPPV